MRDARLPTRWTRSLDARRALTLVLGLAAALLTLALHPGASYAARAWAAPIAQQAPDRPVKPSITDAQRAPLHAIVPAAVHIVHIARTDAGPRLVPFVHGFSAPIHPSHATAPYAPVWTLGDALSPSRARSLLMVFLN